MASCPLAIANFDAGSVESRSRGVNHDIGGAEVGGVSVLASALQRGQRCLYRADSIRQRGVREGSGLRWRRRADSSRRYFGGPLASDEIVETAAVMEWRRRGWEDGWKAGWKRGWQEWKSREDVDVDEWEEDEDVLVLSPEWAERFAKTEKRRAKDRARKRASQFKSPKGKHRRKSGNDSVAEDGEIDEEADSNEDEEQAFEDILPILDSAKHRDQLRIQQYGPDAAKAVADLEGAMNASFQAEKTTEGLSTGQYFLSAYKPILVELSMQSQSFRLNPL